MLSAHFFSLSTIHWTLCVLNLLFHHSNSFLLLVSECDFWWMDGKFSGAAELRFASQGLQLFYSYEFSFFTLETTYSVLLRSIPSLEIFMTFECLPSLVFSSSLFQFKIWHLDIVYICISLRAHLMYQFIRFISTDDSLVYASLATN